MGGDVWPWVAGGGVLAATAAATAVALSGRARPPVGEEPLRWDANDWGQLDFPEPSSAPQPRGAGISVYDYRHGHGPELAERLQALGLDFVALQAARGRPSGKVARIGMSGGASSRLARTAAACRDVGIRVWVWGWPDPRAGDFASNMLEAESLAGADGIFINAEAPYYPGTLGAGVKSVGAASDAAHALVEELAASSGPVGLSSYGGGPPSHPRFPWGAFSRLSFANAQIYGVRYDRARVLGMLRAWSELWPGSVGINIGASSAQTPATIVRRERQAPAFIPHLRVWSWGNIVGSPDRRAAVRQAASEWRERQGVTRA